jgi:hypothetical protein
MNSDLEKNLIRLRRISNDLFRNSLGDAEREWLSKAIYKIYQGDDPYEVFEIEAGRGQRRENTHRNHLVDLAMHLAAGLHDKQFGGGKTLQESIEIAADTFGLEVDTLKRYWNDNQNKYLRSVNRDGDTYD